MGRWLGWAAWVAASWGVGASRIGCSSKRGANYAKRELAALFALQLACSLRAQAAARLQAGVGVLAGLCIALHRAASSWHPGLDAQAD